MDRTLVIHEDGKPFIRLERFTDHEKLKLMIARTHNRLLDHGYNLVDTREKDTQKAMSYQYSKFDEGKHSNVYVVLTDG